MLNRPLLVALAAATCLLLVACAASLQPGSGSSCEDKLAPLVPKVVLVEKGLTDHAYVTSKGNVWSDASAFGADRAVHIDFRAGSNIGEDTRNLYFESPVELLTVLPTYSKQIVDESGIVRGYNKIVIRPLELAPLDFPSVSSKGIPLYPYEIVRYEVVSCTFGEELKLEAINPYVNYPLAKPDPNDSPSSEQKFTTKNPDMPEYVPISDKALYNKFVALKKGMSTAEVKRIAGEPSEISKNVIMAGDPNAPAHPMSYMYATATSRIVVWFDTDKDTAYDVRFATLIDGAPRVIVK